MHGRLAALRKPYRRCYPVRLVNRVDGVPCRRHCRTQSRDSRFGVAPIQG